MTTIPKNSYNGDGTKNSTIEELPQIDAILDIPEMLPQEHKWIQINARHIQDICDNCPRMAVEIPDGKTLIKDEKGYRLVDDAVAVELNTRK